MRFLSKVLISLVGVEQVQWRFENKEEGGGGIQEELMDKIGGYC